MTKESCLSISYMVEVNGCTLSIYSLLCIERVSCHPLVSFGKHHMTLGKQGNVIVGKQVKMTNGNGQEKSGEKTGRLCSEESRPDGEKTNNSKQRKTQKDYKRGYQKGFRT
ncbi:hypothetical protein D0Y65_021572 [Glycine soja]|uniref:Uncharacterized protein n=1 Tax=Glycine soja TaxID=3848 RepID=A0A445JJW1_GLYSO|nr:hypothetical protein D0Y65_021572 [Glycine soja]